jgi:hypothetical protein
MGEDRIQKKVLNIKLKKSARAEDREQGGNNRLGKMSHRRKIGRPCEKTDKEELGEDRGRWERFGCHKTHIGGDA